MSIAAKQLPRNNQSKYVSDDTKIMAAVIREPSAAFVLFRWQQPDFPPPQNVHSATCSLTAAARFGGDYAIYAKM